MATQLPPISPTRGIEPELEPEPAAAGLERWSSPAEMPAVMLRMRLAMDTACGGRSANRNRAMRAVVKAFRAFDPHHSGTVATGDFYGAHNPTTPHDTQTCCRFCCFFGRALLSFLSQ